MVPYSHELLLWPHAKLSGYGGLNVFVCPLCSAGRLAGMATALPEAPPRASSVHVESRLRRSQVCMFDSERSQASKEEIPHRCVAVKLHATSGFFDHDALEPKVSSILQ